MSDILFLTVLRAPLGVNPFVLSILTSTSMILAL